MFDQIAKQLQTLDNRNKNFKITEQEFEIFSKEFLFERIKGDKKLGEVFCEKYGLANYVLSILNDKAATEHIRKFYIK